MQWRKIWGNGGEGKPLSPQKWLERRGVGKNAFQLHEVDEKKIEFPDDYLEKFGIDESAITTGQDPRRGNSDQRSNERRIILWFLVVPMSIIPICLTASLVLSWSGRGNLSEKMQFAVLGALSTNFLGICYVVTRDLFPQGNNSYRKTSLMEADDEDDAQSDNEPG